MASLKTTSSEGIGGSSRLPLWVAVLVMIVGMVGAVLGASSVGRSATNASRQAFTKSSGEVASTLALALQHEEDLIINANAQLMDNPSMSTAAYVRWLTSVRAFERYPELLGLSKLNFVPAEELPAYAAWVARDAAGPFGSGTPFAVLPPGPRPFYCLQGATAARPGVPLPPAGFDFCTDSASGPGLMRSRDSGQGSYTPLTLPGLGTVLGLNIPLYRGGVVPATVEARRQAFAGWSGMGVLPQKVLDRALAAHPTLAATIQYRRGSSDVTFGEAPRVAGGQTTTTDLHNGWIVTTFGPAIPSGIWGNAYALVVLIGGSIFSLLVAMFIYVLATGRARAERTVRLRTDELRHQALHDSLTGLANRVLVADRAEQLLARARRHGTATAALYLDLDGFKAVNDTRGHEAGDQLLKAVAGRLTSVVRDADTIARMGGDEFVILIDGASLEVAPELVAERVLAVLRQPFELQPGEPTIHISASIGISTGDHATGDELIHDADVAMYAAKALGKDGCVFFQPEMQSMLSDGMELELDLRSALANDEFRLYYQPIYDLADLSLISVEALLRWEHPTKGLLAPDLFIPLLERNGHILEVGQWVLTEACRQMALWHALGSNLSVSVNVSARQFDSDAIVDHVRHALEASGLPPESLIIEITETAVMRDIAATGTRLRQIKALGAQVAIDDFGTGYSSLAYLQELPIDSLKIDRSFISAMNPSPESQAIVRTIVQLGRDLGLKTLAEGVETTAQVDQLRDQHVDEAQGFLMARPLDPATFETTILLTQSETV